MTAPTFGQTPPRHVTTSRPLRSTPCELPHFTKAGEPAAIAGIVYRWAGGSQVLCVAHGRQLIARITEAGA